MCVCEISGGEIPGFSELSTWEDAIDLLHGFIVRFKQDNINLNIALLK